MRHRSAVGAVAKIDPENPAPGQFGHEAGMVDMRMGQHQRIERRRVKGEGAIVEFTLRFRALHQPAIDQHFCCVGLEQKARAGDRMRGAVKC